MSSRSFKTRSFWLSRSLKTSWLHIHKSNHWYFSISKLMQKYITYKRCTKFLHLFYKLQIHGPFFFSLSSNETFLDITFSYGNPALVFFQCFLLSEPSFFISRKTTTCAIIRTWCTMCSQRIHKWRNVLWQDAWWQNVLWQNVLVTICPLTKCPLTKYPCD